MRMYALQVLRWYGYFQESVADSPLENFRVRKVILHYYLENDTLEVIEPKQDNSGMPQASLYVQGLLSSIDSTAHSNVCTRT